MLTYPITMMFWKIAKYTQIHACVIAWAAGPTSSTLGPGLSLPGVPWNLCTALGCTGLGPPPRSREGRAGTAPTTLGDAVL